jgi:prevent-host-death family protein
MRVGIRELRGDLAGIVRRASGGEPVVVTVDGRPIARVVPIEPTAGGPTIDDLLAVGLVLPPRRADRPAAPAPLDVPVDARTDRALREVR